MILRLLPFLLLVLWAVVATRFTVRRMTADFEKRSVPLHEAALENELKKLAQVLELPSISVRVLDVEPINGLAAADGRIYLTRGFIEAYRRGLVSAPELAAVIAHELGHVAMGHARRRMIDFTGQSALQMALILQLSRFLPFIGVLIANVITASLAARLSRRDEYEADEWASALLIRAGIGIDPQISLFQRLDHLTGMNKRPPAWLMSHPATEQRIAAIRDHAARWQAT